MDQALYISMTVLPAAGRHVLAQPTSSTSVVIATCFFQCSQENLVFYAKIVLVSSARTCRILHLLWVGAVC